MPNPTSSTMPSINSDRPASDASILGIILAGGKSQRMKIAGRVGDGDGNGDGNGDGDKPALKLAGVPLIEHVCARLSPQVGGTVVSGPHNYGLDLPHVPDLKQGAEGPVAGIAAVWHWAIETNPETSALLSVPADTPFLPDDLVARLCRGGADTAAIAFGDDRLQPAFGYWPMDVIAKHAGAFERDGWLSLKRWATLCRARTVYFDQPADAGAFRNINRPEDLAAAEAWLSAKSG